MITGLAYDAANKILYFSDFLIDAIFAYPIDSTTVTQIAGNGVGGYSGDCRPGILAQLDGPFGIIYNAGNLYISDTNSGRIRVLALQTGTPLSISTSTYNPLTDNTDNTRAPIIFTTTTRGADPSVTTVVGSTVNSIGIVETNTVKDTITPALVKEFFRATTMTAFCLDEITNILYYAAKSSVSPNPANLYYKQGTASTGILLVSQNFVNITSITLYTNPNNDEKSLVVTDSDGNRIYKVSLPGAVVTTLVGTGVRAYSPDDTKASPTTTTVERVATLQTPHSALYDRNGLLVFTESGSSQIRRINAVDRLETIIGIDKSTTTKPESTFVNGKADGKLISLSAPTGLAIDTANNIYFSDATLNSVYMYNTEGIVQIISSPLNSTAINLQSSAEALPASSYYVTEPSYLSLDSQMNLYCTSKTLNQIIYFTDILTTPSIQVALNLGNTSGTPSGDTLALYVSMNKPTVIQYCSSKGILYYLDSGNNIIQQVISIRVNMYSKGATGILPYGPVTAIANPLPIYSWLNTGSTAISEVIYSPYITTDLYGYVYISNFNAGQIRRIDTDGSISLIIEGLKNPLGICIYNSQLYAVCTNATNARTIIKINLVNTTGTYTQTDVFTSDFPGTTLTDISGVCSDPRGFLYASYNGGIQGFNLTTRAKFDVVKDSVAFEPCCK